MPWAIVLGVAFSMTNSDWLGGTNIPLVRRHLSKVIVECSHILLTLLAQHLIEAKCHRSLAAKLFLSIL